MCPNSARWKPVSHPAGWVEGLRHLLLTARGCGSPAEATARDRAALTARPGQARAGGISPSSRAHLNRLVCSELLPIPMACLGTLGGQCSKAPVMGRATRWLLVTR